MKIGKSYAKCKPKNERPEGDFYGTPISLLWELLRAEKIDKSDILEPACGLGYLSNEMKKLNFNVTANDLYYKNKINFLDYNKKHKTIITNPPFSEFDAFVEHAKKTATEKIYMIGKTNFFGAYKRHYDGIWNGLKKIYVFNRQIDYRSEYDANGLFSCGCLVSGWFVWEKGYKGRPEFDIMDINKYVKKSKKRVKNSLHNKQTYDKI